MARRVLLLDDEPLILRALKRAFATHGVDVFTTTDAAEALAEVGRAAPDAIVSDLHMPEEDGARFLTEAARIAPGTVRVLLSADLDFHPRVGRVEDAKVHALVGKADMRSVPELVLAQLEARHAAPADDRELVALAQRFARAMARPQHEDDAHRDRLAALVTKLGARLGLSAAELFDARLGAILHDVGQITVPERVFDAPPPLGAADRVELHKHPDAGARLVAEVPALARAAPIVRAHHAGAAAGYPAGEELVSTAARALHVVDAYDAMRRGRPWARPRAHAEALEDLERSAVGAASADVVRAFAALGEA